MVSRGKFQYLRWLYYRITVLRDLDSVVREEELLND